MKNQICILLLALFSFSCNKEVVRESPVPTGSIIGYVKLYDEFNHPVDDCSGVTVKLGGSSPEISVVTDKNGKYTIENVPSANYIVVYSKDGYGDYITYNFEFVCGNVPFYVTQTIQINKKSTTTCEIVKLESSVNMITQRKEIVTTCNISPAGTDQMQRGVMFFIDTVNTVSSTKYLRIAHEQIYVASSSVLTDDIMDQGMDSFFKTGTKIYVRAYGVSIGDMGYFDLENRKYIYPTLSTVASPVYSFLIP